MHLAYMELRLSVALFFRLFRGSVVHPSLTEDDMYMLNYTLVMPKGHKCHISLSKEKAELI